MSNGITIRELAEACGVSIGTVSKALRHSERISPATIERIEQKARELGYVGNHAARALSARGRRVAVVLPPNATQLDRYREGLRMAETVALFHGVTLCETEEVGEGYDAVLTHPALASRLQLPPELPIALFGGRAPTLHPVLEVMPEYRVGGRLAAQFLAFATGGGATAVLAARRGVYGEEEAVRGFRELSAKLGLSVVSVEECGESVRAIGTEVRRLLLANPRLRGIFVTSSFASAVAAALAESRRRVTVVAADFTRPAIEGLRAGNVAALLYPSPERQVQTAVEALCGYFKSGIAPGSVSVRQELVLKSNLESYL